MSAPTTRSASSKARLDQKNAELITIARAIKRCRICRIGGTGIAVPGEGSANAKVMFIGEAPGKEEAKVGRPFIGRSGKFLRAMIASIGLSEQDIFLTSPGPYLPGSGTPTQDAILHGRTHLAKQLAVIDPRIIVLLGNTACLALLDRKVPISKEHGSIVEKDGRTALITFHPAYAMRFPEGKKQFIRDFEKLKGLMR